MVSWPESSCSSPVTLKQTFFPFLSPFSLSLSAGIKGSGVLRSDLGEYVIEERRLWNTEMKKQIHVFQKWASNRITFFITILQLLFYNMWREYLNSVNTYFKEGKEVTHSVVKKFSSETHWPYQILNHVWKQWFHLEEKYSTFSDTWGQTAY